MPLNPAAIASSPRRALSADALVLLVLLGLAAIKAQAFFPDGRIWAEEGKYFYPAIAEQGFFGALTFIFHGYLALPANLIVWCSALVPFRTMPLVLTYLSLLCQLVPVVMIVVNRQVLGIHPLVLAGWMAIYVGMPQAAEIFATSTNLHFHLSLIVATVLLLPTTRGPSRWVMRGFLLLSGLGGIPANALLPLLVVKAYRTTDRERWIQAAILAVTFSLQLALLLSHPGESGERQYGFNPWVILLASSSQQVIGPLLGLTAGEPIAAAMRTAIPFSGPALPLALLSSMLVSVLYWTLYRAGDTDIDDMLAASAILIVLGCSAVLGDRQNLVSTGMNGRYFVVPNLLIFLAIGKLMTRRRAGYLTLFFCFSVISCAWLGTTQILLGTPWRTAYRRCMAAPHCSEIEIWPAGWRMDVPPAVER